MTRTGEALRAATRWALSSWICACAHAGKGGVRGPGLAPGQLRIDLIMASLARRDSAAAPPASR